MQNYLDGEKNLVSGLWYDQGNAAQLARKAASSYNVDEQTLSSFAEQGFVILRATAEIDSLVEELLDDVEREWKEQKGRSIYAGPGKKRTILSDVPLDGHRVPGYRFADPHGFSEAAQKLIMLPSVFAVLNALFGEPAVAFQSLFFEWGSQQALHRDPMFVRTEPPSALLATWLALEDIHPESGPLVFVPESHRYPWYEFVEGDVYVDKSKDTEGARREFREQYLRIMKEKNHKTQELIINKGDLLIWHGNLLHGGAKVKDSQRTRKSLVTHYSVASGKTDVSQSIFVHNPAKKLVQLARKSDEVIKVGEGRLLQAPWTSRDLEQKIGEGFSSAPDA